MSVRAIIVIAVNGIMDFLHSDIYFSELSSFKIKKMQVSSVYSTTL